MLKNCQRLLTALVSIINVAKGTACMNETASIARSKLMNGTACKNETAGMSISNTANATAWRIETAFVIIPNTTNRTGRKSEVTFFLSIRFPNGKAWMNESASVNMTYPVEGMTLTNVMTLVNIISSAIAKASRNGMNDLACLKDG